ncbi:MAG: AAA family ATPase [Thermodesulfobacteriota bacterium]|nr:AAA family ATPase [Thermodesulfobacteriota bacterium]
MLELKGYSIIEEIFRGYHATLYRGIRDSDKSPVLIKTFVTEDVTQAQIAKFKLEFSNTLHIISDNIIKPKCIEEYRNGIAFVMEDFAGLPIREYFQNSSHSMIPLFLDISIQLVDALITIHKHNIIHKEVTPRNILVDAKIIKAKIMDFGLSSILTREYEDIYNPEVLRDILPYISPEQTGRMNRIIDYRTDIYSLGVVLYEMLTGVLPFYSDNPIEIFHGHIAIIPNSPKEVNPDVPEEISNIIMKMLSKDPEDRYHSGYMLRADLDECLDQIRRVGRIRPFTIGKFDISDRLVLPQKIYGREKETDFLMAAFDLITEGNSKVILVKGPAGIGKTMLVNEIHRPVVARGGFFISGKFDRLSMNKPYSAFIQSFQELIRQVLSGSEEKINKKKRRLKEALCGTGKIITDIIPDVELLIGKQPDVVKLGPEETRNRFHIVFRKFISVFAKKEHPLVLFADDLQWADISSLKMFHTLVEDSSLKYILFIGAIRKAGITSTHPIFTVIKEMENGDIPFNSILLEPLNLANVNCFICDTLKTNPKSTKFLSEQVYRKTGGNPLFIKQILKMLYEEKILEFLADSGWQWDMRRIERMDLKDNLLDLMITRIQKLSEGSKELVKLASAIGNNFDLQTLAKIYGRSVEETYANLLEAIMAGLVFSRDKDYIFVHDRIQEAVYSLLSEQERGRLHDRIGNVLLKSGLPEVTPDGIFNIVDQLNLGKESISSPQEQDRLAQLNLIAAKEAKLSSAYESSLKYIDQGMALLSENSWEKNYPLTFSYYIERGNVEYLFTDWDRSLVTFDEAFKHARNLLDRCKICRHKMILYRMKNELTKCLKLGIETLDELGIELKAFPNESELMTEIDHIRTLLANKDPEYLYNLPEMEDQEKLVAMEILLELASPCYFLGSLMLHFLGISLIELSLVYGNNPFTAVGYAFYSGVTLTCVLHDFENARKYGELAVRLNDERYCNRTNEALIMNIWGGFISHHIEPIDSARNHLMRGYKSGLQNGAYYWAGYCAVNFIMGCFWGTNTLEHLSKKIDEILPVLCKVDQNMAQFFYGIKAGIFNLTTVVEDKADLSHIWPDSTKVIENFAQKNDVIFNFFSIVLKLCLSNWYSGYEMAIKFAQKAEKSIVGGVGTFIEPVFNLHQAIAFSATYDDADSYRQSQYLEKIKQSIARFEQWAKFAPATYMHQVLLIKAELARILGKDFKKVMDLYDMAIDAANESGFLQNEALANELAARFYLAQGKEKIASLYMQQARYTYAKWGAKGKAMDMEKRYPHLLKDSLDDMLDLHAIRHPPDLPQTNQSLRLDYVSVIKSLQAISSEIIREKLLEILMKVVVETAGASRGLYVSVRGCDMFVEAERITEGGGFTRTKPVSVDEYNNLLMPVANCVKQTMAHLVVDDATKEKDYMSDPYMIQSEPKSILCIPVIRQSNLMGMLYLENKYTANAFTPDRVEVLHLLASQAAISLENAMLVEDMKRAQLALRESETRFRDFIDNLADMAYETDSMGNITYVNKMAETIVGVPLNDLLGRSYFPFITRESQETAIDVMQRTLNGESLEFELNFTSGRTCQFKNEPLRNKDEQVIGFFGIARDITERKRTEEETVKYKAQLQRVKKVEAIGTLAGGVAHDFNNLLMGIQGRTSLMMMKINSGHPHYEHLKGIDDTVKSAVYLTRQLLGLARGGKYEVKPVDLNEIVREQTLLFGRTRKEIIVHEEYKDRLLIVKVDQGQIEQVLLNIYINAWQAMPGGGHLYVQTEDIPLSQAFVRPFEVKPGRYVRVSIRDTGMGMDEETQQKIFDPFFTTKELGRGTGLGLASVYGIIKNHGGFIDVFSEVGRGAKFDIYLPASKAKIRKERTVSQELLKGIGTLLFVDDESQIIEVGVEMLETLGYKVLTAKSGKDAIQIYKERGDQIDLVILDMIMPGLDGGDTYDMLKEINHDVRVLLSSGYSIDGEAESILERGCNGFIQKPFKIEQVSKKVKEVMKKTD